MTCLNPYKVPQVNEGRFLQWTPINYFLEEQTEPITLCPPSTDPCVYLFPDQTESYPLPIQSGDVIQWIMNKNEISLDGGSTVASLKIALVQEGVLVAADIGTVSEAVGGSQYYCTATIPCIPEGCNYQLVVYDYTVVPPIECGSFAGDTLQMVINDNVTLSQVLDCYLSDFI